jgi:hypothetical protein
MDSTGKWYLWKNEATTQREFWSANGWTKIAKEAAFFDSELDAHDEAAYRADGTTRAEVVVDRATRNVFA